MHDGTPNYRSYTMAQLLDAQRSVDADRYPENASALQAEIQRRQEGGNEERAEREELPVARRPKKRRAPYTFVIKMSGFLIVLQPLAFTFFGVELASRSFLLPVILIPIGLAGGVVGLGMILSAPWLPRWFPIWIPFHLGGVGLTYYALGEAVGGGIPVMIFLVFWLVVLNRFIQADASSSPIAP